MQSAQIFSDQTLKFMRNEIKKADNNEVYFKGKFNFSEAVIDKVEVIARGNDKMAPAIVNNLKPGLCVIHNHPSGDLRPSAADIKIASKLGNRGVGFIIVDNEVKESYVVVEPEQVGKREPLPRQKLLELLQSGGGLEKVLSDFRERKEQLSVLDRIISAFNDREKVMIEAGTGIGKSFAYLLPAIFWNELNEEVIVISTNTINLQQQLLEKDLVQLKQILPFDFKAILVKGRNNYICKRKVHNILNQTDDEGEDSKLTRVARHIYESFKEENYSGAYSEFDFSVSVEIWQELRSESDLCLGSNCPHVEKCFFQKAREEVHKSDILIVNHHLLLSDVILKEQMGGILPDFNKLIIDEAHNLPEAAHNISGKEFHAPKVLRLLNRLKNSINSPMVKLRNLDVVIEESIKKSVFNIIDNQLWPLSQRLEDAIKEYGQKLEDLMSSDQKTLRLKEMAFSDEEKLTWKTQGDKVLQLLQQFENKLEELKELLTDNIKNTPPGKNPIIQELTGYIERINKFMVALELNLNFDSHQDRFVFWLQRDNYGGNFKVRQKNSRIKVNDFLQETLYSRLVTLILTSATLAVKDDFSYFKERLGLSKADQLKISSPFDYENQAEIFAPENIPAVTEDDFIEKIMPDLAEVVLSTEGGSLLLFTSYNMLHETKNLLNPYLNNSSKELLIQGESSRQQILNRLKTSGSSILLGTSSFWEGIDVQGSALSLLVIMRLPFAVPSNPIVAARQEMIENQGKNPFYEETLPGAVLRFKQGFGRLIRAKSDTGKVVILDRRIMKRRYGKYFIKSLPEGCNVKNNWPNS